MEEIGEGNFAPTLAHVVGNGGVTKRVRAVIENTLTWVNFFSKLTNLNNLIIN